jgi:uncharacterized protein YaiL (DUF2058 family)
MIEKDRHVSFEDSGIGIGQNADGKIETFPASELAERVAQRDADEAATEYAIEQSEQGFPEEDDTDDVSDLDDIEDLLAEEPEDGG